MPNSQRQALDEQQFLYGLETELWKAADKLRGSLDAANYKHAVLGLIFLKYISDGFEARRDVVKKMLAEEYPDENEAWHAEELEDRDYYTQENVFWVPYAARWSFLQKNAKLNPGQKVEYTSQDETHSYTFKSPGKLIDDCLNAIEGDNPRLKGVLNKSYTTLRIDATKLVGLIDLIGNIPFNHASLASKDILGHVYEYFLGQFALAEGKKGGQFYTPKSVVTLIVELLQPFSGRVYDPAMGSGGFFVQSERFLREHGKGSEEISVFGQELNYTTWQLAAMNLAIRNMDFNFGDRPADSFTDDLHPDLEADYVMANPPFNIKDWWHESLEGDVRWKYGTPPKGNANFAWLQHMLHHLSHRGTMALLLANGSMSSTTNTEGDIRKNLVLKNRVDCIIALPGQLFTNTQIPACIWILAKDHREGGRGLRNRSDQVLFIDARERGYMKGRVLRDFTTEEITEISRTYLSWRASFSQLEIEDEQGKQAWHTYEDIPGFCKSATREEIKDHDYVLTPGRYVGAPPEEEDSEPFAEKMARLTSQLRDQFAESRRLEEEIKKNLAGLGYEI